MISPTNPRLRHPERRIARRPRRRPRRLPHHQRRYLVRQVRLRLLLQEPHPPGCSESSTAKGDLPAGGLHDKSR